MTREELLALPLLVDVPTAAAVLGVGRSRAYELVQTGRWPTPVLRFGRNIRVPTAPLLEAVGVEPPSSEHAPTA